MCVCFTGITERLGLIIIGIYYNVKIADKSGLASCGLNLNHLDHTLMYSWEDKYQHCGSKRVKVKICGRLPNFDRILTRYEVSCLLVLRLLSYTSSTRRIRRKTWTKWENCYNFGQKW